MDEIKIIKSTAKEYPQKLLNIENPPKQLYIKGNEKLLYNSKILAMVGSRICTEYGRKQATYFASELSKQKICIISGMALGIDAAAHIGAMKQQRKNNCSVRRRIQTCFSKRK